MKKALSFIVGFLAVSWNVHALTTTVVAWGDNTYGQTNIPAGLTNVTAIAQGGMHGLALNGDSTVTAWGYNYTWTTPHVYEGQAVVPVGLSNVTAVAAGYDSSLALKNDGTIVFWGDTGETNLPNGLSNIVAIATGNGQSIVLKNDNTVIVWGYNGYGQTNIPAGLTNVVAIAAGGSDNVALLQGGTVAVWGSNIYNQTNVPNNATNIISVAAGLYHILALRGDSTVIAWGYNGYGQTNIPTGLTNVVAIAAGDMHSMALKKDGTVVAWGYNNAGQCTIPYGLSNVVSISARRYQSLALANDGSPWFIQQPISQTTYSGMNATFTVLAIGKTNLNYQWYFNGTNILSATNASLLLSNVQTQNSGNYSVMLSNAVGVVISSNAVLTVSNSPPIISQPASQLVVALHSNALLTVTSSGSLPQFYQWQFNGTNITGATNIFLSLTNAQLTNSGNYAAIITNSYGSTTGLVVSLTVMDLGAALNETNLVWTTSGSYQWFPETSASHDGIAAAQSATPPYFQYSTLQTTVTGPGTLTFWAECSQFSDSYTFTASGSNGQVAFIPPFAQWVQESFYLGTGTQSLLWRFQRSSFGGTGLDAAWLDQVSYVSGATPATISSISPSQNVPAATNVILTVQAVGTPPLAFQWQFNGTNLLSATNTSLALTNVQNSNSGNYVVIVTNGYGVASSNIALTVTPVPPFITTQPTNQAIWIRSNVTFQVAAQGSIPFSYQWQFNGTNIDGATNSTFSLGNLQKTNAGYYQAVVSNDVGKITSSNAALSVVTSAVVVWGGDSSAQTNVPFACINPSTVTAAADAGFALSVNGDSTVTTWGDSPPTIPVGLTNVIAVAAESADGLALKRDGTVAIWGSDFYGQADIPPRLTNVTQIAAGDIHMLALRQDGTVFAWGPNNNGQINSQTNVPDGLINVTAVSAGSLHSVALTGVGTVVAWVTTHKDKQMCQRA